MNRKTVLALLVCVVTFSARAAAEDTYTIKLGKPTEGDAVLITREETSEARTTIKEGDKAASVVEQRSAEVFRFREEVVEKKPGKRAARLLRAYQKAEVATDGKRADLGLQGKTVEILRRDGRFTFRFQGGTELGDKDARVLAKEFNQEKGEDDEVDQLSLPRKPVAVGDTWTLDMDAILKDLSRSEKMDIDAAKAAGSGKLVKAYQKDGHQFGVLEIKMELPIKQIGDGDSALLMAPGARLTIAQNLDACIDGSVARGMVTHKFRMSGTGTQASNKARMVTIDVTGTGTESREEARK